MYKRQNVGYDRERNAFWMVPCEYVPVSYPGTGDMYASVLIGGFLSGDSLPIAMDRATRFTELAIQTTFSYGTDTPVSYTHLDVYKRQGLQ